MPDLVQLSAQFSPEQQFLCFPKQRVARGKESVSNPSPNNTRDPAKRAKFLANCGLIKPPYRTVAIGQNTAVGIGTDHSDRPYHGPGIALHHQFRCGI
jgi:hypothetical protein